MWRSAAVVRVAHWHSTTTTLPADFTVGDIRVEGLQRVSEGTVYNYLPVNIGDHLNPQRVREAIRALYATGFFRDVQMRREGNTLVVVVLERPSIESFEITGNKDIKTEDLQKSLRGVGLATGKTFDRSVLEDVTQYLTDQYFARGKYGVRIDTKVEEESGNRVKIKIDIKEGTRAKIRQINIVGNTKFKDKDDPRHPGAEDPELAVLVQAGRPLLARVAAGRPREAPQLLHGPRLRELPDRLDPGGDRAGEGRHLHHGQRRARARSSRSPRSSSPAPSWCRRRSWSASC